MVRTRPCRYQCSLPVKFLKSASVSFFLSVMVSAFLVWFWVASADATLAVAETGGCKPQAPSRGTETQRRLRASSARNGVCRFGRKALAARRGQRPQGLPAAGGHRCVSWGNRSRTQHPTVGPVHPVSSGGDHGCVYWARRVAQQNGGVRRRPRRRGALARQGAERAGPVA